MKLSFIVPVYNTEQFLEKCLQSILNQELSPEDYEVIIVNDGSPDNSQVIIDQFTEQYSQFISITTPNRGLSAARNVGIRQAKGDYLFFIDSDDYLEDRSLLKVIEKVYDKNLDCISFDYKKILEDDISKDYRVISCYNGNKIYSGDVFLYENTIISNVWKYLFRRTILTQNELYFTEGIYHEDEDFTILFLSYCNKIKHDNVLVYNYIQREGSIVNTNDLAKKRKKLLDIITVVKNIKKRYDTTFGTLQKGLGRKIEQLLVSLFLRLKNDGMSVEDIQLIRTKLKEEQLYPIKVRHENLKFKMMAFIINRPILYRLFYSGK